MALARVVLSLVASFGALCATRDTPPDARVAQRSGNDTVLVYVAASLARPMQPLFDAFAQRTGTVVLTEAGGSLEHARKILSLHRVPDLLVLADDDVFRDMLAPAHAATWWADFARNRMAILYTPRSRHASEIGASNWTEILTRDDVAVGRSDPRQAPVGYRTLLTMQLAEHFYRKPGLAAALLAHAPDENVRPNATALVALLETGDLDYIYDYASLGRTYNLRVLDLPDEIDLGDPARAKEYSAARIARSDKPGTFIGAPIVYSLGTPVGAPHGDAGVRLAALLVSPEGRAMLRANGIDALEHATIAGAAPDAVRRAAAQ